MTACFNMVNTLLREISYAEKCRIPRIAELENNSGDKTLGLGAFQTREEKVNGSKCKRVDITT